MIKVLPKTLFNSQSNMQKSLPYVEKPVTWNFNNTLVLTSIISEKKSLLDSASGFLSKAKTVIGDKVNQIGAEISATMNATKKLLKMSQQMLWLRH